MRDMEEDVRRIVERYPADIRMMFVNTRKIIMNCIPIKPMEKLCLKTPTYYVGKACVCIRPYKHRIDIEAEATVQHKKELLGYRITGKNVLQISEKQELPYMVLREIFTESLGSRLGRELRNLRLTYREIGPGGTGIQFAVWEEENKLCYSWYFPFANTDNRYMAFGRISEVMPAEFDEKIKALGRGCNTKTGPLIMCSNFIELEIYDKAGMSRRIEWDSNDYLSDELTEFMGFVGRVIGDNPFSYRLC